MAAAASPPPRFTGPGFWEPIALFGVLSLVVAAVYGRVSAGFFVDADFEVLARAEAADDLRAALASGPPAPAFQPLTAASFWLSNLGSGRDPAAFRFTNLALHALNAWLVARLVWQLLANRAGAAFAGLCFALTPAGAECAGWIAGRHHLLTATGVLLSTIGWLRFCQGRGGVAALMTVLGLGTALLAADAGLAAPLVILLITLIAPPAWETYRLRPVAMSPATASKAPTAFARIRRGRRRGIERSLATIGLLVLVGIYLAVRQRAGAGLALEIFAGESGSPQLEIVRRFLADASHLLLAPGPPWLGFLCMGLSGTLALPLLLDASRESGTTSASPGASLTSARDAAGGPAAGRRAGPEAEALTTRPTRVVTALIPALLVVLGAFAIALLPAANRVILDPATGENARFAYLPAVFACALLGLLAGAASALRHRALPWICLGVLGCLGGHLVQANENWRRAGAESQALIDALRARTARAPGLKFVFVHALPTRRQGAFVFQRGFATAVRKFVRWDLEFPPNGALSAADWRTHAAARRTNPDLHPEALLVRWDSTAGVLIDP